ncbi:MAG: M3 family oligoendopeptidase [Pseudohongiellaceae bacterium]|jgi:M3 family oligoendopeptidase
MLVPPPHWDAIAARYDALQAAWEAADDSAERRQVILDWDALRRETATWSALAHLRFQRDTRDEQAIAARALVDTLGPRFDERDSRIQRLVLDGPHRGEVAEHFGEHVLDLWTADTSTISPSIQDDLVTERERQARYSSLQGSARIAFAGEEHTLSGMLKYRVSPDRELRRGGSQAYWSWYSERADDFDALYDELVSLRTSMARRLGHKTFVPVAYQRKRRVDYDRHDVARYREQILEEVVPLAAELREQQRKGLGLDTLHLWDEQMQPDGPPPKPQGGRIELMSRASGMFAATLPELSRLYETMTARELLDLASRDGKSGGGFCTWFPQWGLPYIFANFNGTHGDVRVFTHEMGHAFQRFSSRGQPLLDTVGCTSESAEIHSMSLELLTWPEMSRFFGEEAERFRRVHLADQITFLPYGALVDHFQHRVHDEPEATPNQRAAMWLQLERQYLPWRNHGDLAHPVSGRFWQAQMHIYRVPFYYIDYTLALNCALQLWDRSLSDRDGAWKTYAELCRKGGSMPFGKLVASAGLRSPFEPGCLTSVIGRAREYLSMAPGSC